MTCRIHVELAQEFRLLRLEGSVFSPMHQVEFRKAVQALIDRGGCAPVAIDTAGLLLIGSGCLAAIIEAAMTLHREGIPVVLLEERAHALDVFEVVSIHAILPVHPSLADARLALAG